MALLEEWAGVDQFDTLEDKFNALVEMINTKFSGGLAGDSLIKINGDDFNFEFAPALKWKTINIGNWDMDTDSLVTISTGLAGKTIRVIDAQIRADNGNIFPMSTLDNSTGQMACGYGFGILPSQITLQRTTGGLFDNSNFTNASSYNRGWITIGYID